MSTPNKPITNITQGVTGDLPLAPGRSIEGYRLIVPTQGVHVPIPEKTQLIRIYSDTTHCVMTFKSTGFPKPAGVNGFDNFIPQGHMIDIGLTDNVNGEYPTALSIAAVSSGASGAIYIMFK